MENVRTAVIGIGNMGRSHAKRIQAGEIPGLKLSAVCDRNADALEAFPEAHKFSDSAELIRSGKVDAVIIATPHYDHTTIGIDALENGLHTLVEKPISVHKADCERLIAAHTDTSKTFAAMFNQRTDPHFQKVRDLIKNGDLGAIHRATWTITDWFRSYAYYASGGWRATWSGEGGGVLLNQCPHQIDLWQWMFGMPSKVRAFCEIGRFHDIEVEDDVTAYMEYANGMKGVFITTTGDAPGSNRLEISAENGLVVVEGDDIIWKKNTVPVTEYSRTTDNKFGRPETWSISIPANGRGDQHVGILKNFSAAIREGAELLAPAVEGIHSVELANAMLYSSFTDAAVEMPLDGAAYEAHLNKLIAESTFEKQVDESRAGSDDFAKSF